MGDVRHKDSPPVEYPEETVTDADRKEIRDALDRNESLNAVSGAKRGAANYLIDSRAALRDALAEIDVTTDITQINNIIGPARASSKWNPVHKSRFMQPIRKVLGLPERVTISVPVARVGLIERISSMSEHEFAELERAMKYRRERRP